MEEITTKAHEKYNKVKQNFIEGDLNSTQFMFVTLEAREERHEQEKDKMRKDWKHQRNWLFAVILVLVLGIFSAVFWFASNYELATVSQDVQTGNANYIGNSGDIINGKASD